MSVSSLETNWSPTSHRSLFHVATEVWNGARDLASVIGYRLPANGQGHDVIKGESQMVFVGEKMNDVISCLPLSLTINLETAVCRASVGQLSRLVQFYKTGSV